MKTSSALLSIAFLLPSAMTFAATSAQRANADTAAAAGVLPSVVEKMQRGTSLTISDIQELARQRVTDETTLAYLRSPKADYRLTTESFDALRAAGVSDRVVNYLLLSSPLEPVRAGRVYRAAPARGYGFRPLRVTPGFGRLGGSHGFGGFSVRHRGGHRGGRH